MDIKVRPMFVCLTTHFLYRMDIYEMYFVNHPSFRKGVNSQQQLKRNKMELYGI